MKKKILFLSAVLAVVCAVTCVSLAMSNETQSSAMLNNVEALAQYEGVWPDGYPVYYTNWCWSQSQGWYDAGACRCDSGDYTCSVYDGCNTM